MSREPSTVLGPFETEHRAPSIPQAFLPRHVAIVMDGNGRWANQRGLSRTEGHKAGELALMEVMAGAVELGIEHVSVYAFSTENWKRSPEEVRFLMNFSKDTLRLRSHILNEWGVRIRWSGREPRLWKSVVKTLKDAQQLTQANRGTTLNMCVNYGGRAELVDAFRAISQDVALGKLSASSIKESTIQRYLYCPDLPDVDLFIRTSKEQRTSNFLPWQSTYAELLFIDELWPDVDRSVLFRAVEEYARRDRRYGGAIDRPEAQNG